MLVYLSTEGNNMKVMFFGYIRDITGTKETWMQGPTNLKQLLHKLCDIYGKNLKSRVFDNNDIGREVIILINGRNVAFTGGIETALSEDDEISIFPVMAGG
jgi:molybdopterin synthase sulfur carrier subunit